MKAVQWCALLLAVSGTAWADAKPELSVTVNAAPLPFPSLIELDAKLGLVLRVTPPAGVNLTAQLIESPGTKPRPRPESVPQPVRGSDERFALPW